MNIGTFAGRLGRDAELKPLPSGKALLEFSLAVDVGFGDKKATEWVKCVIWSEARHGVAPYLTKGSAVTVMGRIKSNAYQGKEGLKSEILCDVLELTLQGSRDNASDGAAKPAPARKPEPIAAGSDADPDDAIPFAFAILAPLAGMMAAAATASQYIA
jgi:single-strand DNA-binding protein